MHLMSMESLGISYKHRYYSEKLPELRSFVQTNYPSAAVCVDASDRNVADIEEVDLVVSTFPCQPFSTAGKRKAGSV